jgi:hypothetical protein
MSLVFRTSVFIAYSHEDGDFVEWLVSGLKRQGFDPLWDRNISPGTLWPEQLRSWINQCDVSIVVLSPDSTKSRVVNDELAALIERGRQEGHLTVPVLCRHVDVGDRPVALSQLQYADFRDPSAGARKRACAELCDTLRHKWTGPSERPRRKGLRLRVVGLAVLVFVLLVPIGNVVYPLLVAGNRLEAARVVQRSVEELERRVRSLTGSSAPMPDGERYYVDPSSGEHLATDVWSGGRLTWRDFFRDGKLIARDKFNYAGDTVTGKTRMHLDAEGRAIIIDSHAQSGALIEKKLDCSTADIQACEPRYDILSSPLPPPGLLFYR